MIKKRFKDDDIEFLNELQWWNFDHNEVEKVIEILCESNIEKLKDYFEKRA